MLAVKDTGSRADGNAQALVADRDSCIWTHFDRCANAPEVRPPGTTRNRPQDAALFPLRCLERGVGRAAQFAMNFVGITMTTQLGQERVGAFGRGDGFGSKQRGQAALPVLVLAFDFALGLRRAGITQRDAVEVEGGAFRVLGEEQAVAIHVELQRQTVFAESGREEIEIGQEIFAVVDFGAGADAATVIEQIEQGIVPGIGWEPSMRRRIQLPERACLEALPTAH